MKDLRREVPVAADPLVSVVLIFLDAAAFMDEAIQSVVAQTYARWELILVNDGSTDESPQIATRWAEDDPSRIRHVTHPNGENLGMSASRNLGIREARGTYVAFLDADDVYLPHKLAAQVAILEREKLAAMVYGPSIHWYSWEPGREGRRDVPRRLGVEPDRLVQPPALIARFLTLQAQTPGTCSVLVRRSVCEAVGGFVIGFPGIYEDQVFFYKICAEWPVYVESTSRDMYRQHAGSHGHVVRTFGEWGDGRPAPRYGAFLRWLAGYLDERRIVDAGARAALAHELWPYRSRIHYRAASMAHASRRARRSLVRRLRSLRPRR